MALKVWAANELVTSAKMNTWLAERADTALYASDVSGWEQKSTDTDPPDFTTPLQFWRFDALLGQFLYISYRARNATAGGYDSHVRLRTLSDLKIWGAIDQDGVSDTNYHLHEHLVDLRATGDSGDCDLDARGIAAELKINVVDDNAESYISGLMLIGGNIDDLDAYGSRLDITTATG